MELVERAVRAKHMAERLRRLLAWRRYVPAVAAAAMQVLGDAEVCVVGGTAEDRLTALSDIDVVAASHRELPQDSGRIRVIVETRSIAVEEYGCPGTTL
jgi:predicted nucleotidyltransferase